MLKKVIVLTVLVISLTTLVLTLAKTPEESYRTRINQLMMEKGKIPRAVREERPNDWFYRQRAYPFDSVPSRYYHQALEQAIEMRKAASLDKNNDAAVWTAAGPVNIPGRICDIAVHPSDPNVVYVASASGGIFKTTDLGQNWDPIFDDHGGQPMGAVAIHPLNPSIVYAGTGEGNPAANTYEGDGIYKSTDGGATWSNMGLPNSARIPRIIVDPLYPDTVYVAVLGTRWSGRTPDRGVYRSEDGGASWDKVLYLADSIGCVDLTLQADSGVLLAAMWNRYNNGGGTSIWRSDNRGDTWNQISGANGLPIIYGRPGVTFGRTHNTAYLLYADVFGHFSGLYKSTDLGRNWTPTNGSHLNNLNGSWDGGWYFGNVRVSPTDPDLVFALGLDLFRTTDGGANWSKITDSDPSGNPTPEPHADQHAMYILETDDNYVYLGNDGGVCLSEDRGDTWSLFRNMHNTQFYAICVDYQNPQRLYGGAQDNGSMRTLTGSVDNWDHIFGGDGFYPVVDFTNSNIIYVEFQYGAIYKSYDLGENFVWAQNGINSGDPSNWNTPVVMDYNDPKVLYTGTDKVYKTTDGADNWNAISFSITNGTVTTIDIARTNPDVIYAGCTDGIVAMTTDGGATWANVSYYLPNRWVTRVTVDPHDDAVAYVTFSGYRDGDYLPHIFRTTDYGSNWTDISGNLPDVPVNDCIVDIYHDSALYIATDVGVFVTDDLGATWTPFGTGLPPSVVHDLAYHYSTRSLIAGTHGRSMFRTTIDCDDVTDTDSDGAPDLCDNCPDNYNPDQADFDFDLIGDECDDDDDNDGVPDTGDNCQFFANPDQDDYDNDGIGDGCDACPADSLNDDDNDGYCYSADNCGDRYNPDQEDTDSDGVGDSCDNCIYIYNPGQEDENTDGIGDVCEGCCEGVTGDANCSGGEPDISDITRLIDFLYISHAELCCPEEADANGSGGEPDISDITKLIDHLYLSHAPLPDCP